MQVCTCAPAEGGEPPPVPPPPRRSLDRRAVYATVWMQPARLNTWQVDSTGTSECLARALARRAVCATNLPPYTCSRLTGTPHEVLQYNYKDRCTLTLHCIIIRTVVQ